MPPGPHSAAGHGVSADVRFPHQTHREPGGRHKGCCKSEEEALTCQYRGHRLPAPDFLPQHRRPEPGPVRPYRWKTGSPRHNPLQRCAVVFGSGPPERILPYRRQRVFRYALPMYSMHRKPDNGPAIWGTHCRRQYSKRQFSSLPWFCSLRIFFRLYQPGPHRSRIEIGSRR